MKDFLGNHRIAELLLTVSTLAFCGILLVPVLYGSDIGWNMNDYLVLLFFFSLALVGVCAIALISRSKTHPEEEKEEEKIALMERLQKTVEHETARLRTYNRLEP